MHSSIFNVVVLSDEQCFHKLTLFTSEYIVISLMHDAPYFIPTEKCKQREFGIQYL